MTIQRERLVAAVPAEHPLATRRRLRGEDLRGEAFVILARREAPDSMRASPPRWATPAGSPRTCSRWPRWQTIISLVAGGFGVSLVPASVGTVDRSGVVFRPFAGPTPTIELAVALAQRPGDTGTRRVPVRRPPAARPQGGPASHA